MHKLALISGLVITLIACTSKSKERPFSQYEKFMNQQQLVLDSLPDTLAATLEKFVSDEKPEDGAQLLWTAANINSKAGLMRRSAANLEAIVRDYPNSPIVAEALISAGTTYQNIGMFDHAKKVYGQFLKKFPKHAMHGDIKTTFEMLEKGITSPAEQLEYIQNKKDKE